MVQVHTEVSGCREVDTGSVSDRVFRTAWRSTIGIGTPTPHRRHSLPSTPTTMSAHLLPADGPGDRATRAVVVSSSWPHQPGSSRSRQPGQRRPGCVASLLGPCGWGGRRVPERYPPVRRGWEGGQAETAQAVDLRAKIVNLYIRTAVRASLARYSGYFIR